MSSSPQEDVTPRAPEEELLSSPTKQAPPSIASQDQHTTETPTTSRAQTPSPPAYSPPTRIQQSFESARTHEMDLNAHDDTALQHTRPPSPTKTSFSDYSDHYDSGMLKFQQTTFQTHSRSNPNDADKDMKPWYENVMSTLPVEQDREQDEGRRVTRFEEDTARARSAARESAGRTLCYQSPEMTFATIAKQQASSDENPPELDEQAVIHKRSVQPNLSDETSAAQGSGEPDERKAKVEPDAKPPRYQAAWVRAAINALKANKKNPLQEGNIIVVLNTKDIQKSCLIRSNDLSRVSDSLGLLVSNSMDESGGCVSQQGLSGLLVLSELGSMPELLSRPLDQPECILTPAEEVKARRQSAERSKVKSESDLEDDASKSNAADARIDWPKAYESFFRIISRKRAQGLAKSDPAAALPHIEGIVQIAHKYNAVHVVQNVFDSLFFEYVGNGTFWELIAKEPVRCVKIAIALQKQHVYEEAFKHLVGSSASFKAGKKFDGLPDDVQAIVRRRSSELYSLRRDIDEELLMTTLSLPKKRGYTPKFPSTAVSQHEQVVSYNTVNLFRDWICEHIGYLRLETPRTRKPFYLCDHESGCGTVAGFYRLLALGGDAYLPADKVEEEFGLEFLDKDEENEDDDIRKALAMMKTKASESVSKLIQSTLHLPGKDNLDYVTCVNVEREDVPWDIGRKDEGDEEDDDMDLD